MGYDQKIYQVTSLAEEGRAENGAIVLDKLKLVNCNGGGLLVTALPRLEGGMVSGEQYWLTGLLLSSTKLVSVRSIPAHLWFGTLAWGSGTG